MCKPDIDNPEDYLVFLNDGKIRPKHGLGFLDKKKALNTIQVFNLDGQSKLDNSRHQALANEKQLADKFWEAMSDNDGSEEWRQILEDERLDALTRIESQAHRTALKPLWEFN